MNVANVDWIVPCAVCTQATRDGDVFCSRACLWEAHRELEENQAILQPPAAGSAARASLAARNGYLSSALDRCPTELP